MNYKIEGAIKKSRKTFITCAILWLILVIVFVAPVTYSGFQAKASGTLDLTIFMEQLPTNIIHPFSTIFGIFKNGIFGNFFSFLLVFSIIYLVLFL